MAGKQDRCLLCGKIRKYGNAANDMAEKSDFDHLFLFLTKFHED